MDDDGEEDVHLKTGGLKVLQCEEDDDFMSQFDKMLSDNLHQRSNEAVKVRRGYSYGAVIQLWQGEYAAIVSVL